ncbi:MAG TPA: DMT family transporter [Sphingopyxis sp.]|nr:DMT family transporter [Sphingopyxis sp.]HMP44530.1 DMT family transporter [Sphingopyxis sp.]
MSPRIASCLVLPPLIWGSLVVVATGALSRLDPARLTLWTWTIGGLLLLPAAWRNRRAVAAAVRARPAWFLVVGTAGTTGFQYFWYLGLASASAIDVVLLTAALPLFICIGDWFCGARFGAGRWAGLACAAVGCVLLGLPAGGQFDIAQSMGAAAILVANLGMTLYTVALGQRPTGLRADAGLAALVWPGLAVFAAALLLTGNLSAFAAPDPQDADLWMELLYIGGAAYVLAYALWNTSVLVSGAARTGMFLYLQPVFAILLAAALLGETPGPLQLIAGLLILGGLLVSDLLAARHAAVAAAEDGALP